MTNDDDDDAIRLLTLLDDGDADETIIIIFWKRPMRTSFEITRIAIHTSVRRDVWHVTLGPRGRPIALKAMGPQILLLVRERQRRPRRRAPLPGAATRSCGHTAAG